MALFNDAKIGIFFVLNSVLQLTIGVLAFLDAARTSELKKKWFANASILGRTPLRTRIVGTIFLITSAIPTIAGALGAWGFRKSPRIGIDIAMSLNTILVPLVHILTLTRLSRRIAKAAKENEGILSKHSGVLRPRTIHNQELPVHFHDVEAKAQLLHYVQQLQIMRLNDEDEADMSKLQDGLRRSLTPSEVFAVGLLRTKATKPPTYWKLMSSIRNMDIQGRRRTILSLVSIVARCGITVWTFGKPATMTPTEALLYNIFAPAFLTASALVGIWYEKWALQLASSFGRHARDPKESALMVGSWIFLQAFLWGKVFKSAFLGCFFCHFQHVQLIYIVQWIAELHETLANEAWIAFQRSEAGACEVPSWADLEVWLRDFADDEAGFEGFEKLRPGNNDQQATPYGGEGEAAMEETAIVE